MNLQPVDLGAVLIDMIRAINHNFGLIQNGKADVSGVPTKVSELQNDKGYATQSDVLAKINALVSAAPEALNTLNELAAALGNDPNFAATVTGLIAQKVDRETGKGLSSNDFTDAEKTKLAGLVNYSLPVAGAALGGVRNGGNVAVAADGTLNGLAVAKITFAANDARWSALDDRFVLAIPTGGKNMVGVYRKSGDNYYVTFSDVGVEGSNFKISTAEKFDGYIITI